MGAIGLLVFSSKRRALVFSNGATSFAQEAKRRVTGVATDQNGLKVPSGSAR
jgi:hypothetical protein